MADNVTKRKPRLFYLDWVRGLSAILIVITHFNNPYLVEHPIFCELSVRHLHRFARCLPVPHYFWRYIDVFA